MPAPSRATIRIETARKPIFKWYVFGLVSIFALVLLGGGHNAYALGLALILPGLALVFGPVGRSLGRWGDGAVFVLLLLLLGAFLPSLLTGQAEWRSTAESSYHLDLGAFHSVQPRVSLEAWLLALAGFAWLYAAANWPINTTGRRWLMFLLCILLVVFGGVSIYCNLLGLRYPGAEDATAFSFFPNRNQMANFLALGGVVTFGFAIDGLRHRRLIHLAGLFATSVCLMALVLGVSRAGVLLYFTGIFIWFIFRLKGSRVARSFKIGLPLVLIIFSFLISSNERTMGRITHLWEAPDQIREEFRLLLYRDTFKMMQDAPVLGVGLGNYSAVFPQYRDLSRNYQTVVHPESDFFWLASEGGLLAALCLIVFVGAYLLRCWPREEGQGRSYRLTALTAVLIFLLHALVDVPGHRPGTVYFAILFAALALPRMDASERRYNALYFRGVGVVLLLTGVVWCVGALSGWTVYSRTAEAVFREDASRSMQIGDYERSRRSLDRLLSLHPMDWRAYFQRAQLTLAESGNRSRAADDFQRSRYFEPILGLVTMEEGMVWLSYDPGRAVSAFRQTLFRELENKDGAYQVMLRAAKKHPPVMDRMAALSRIDSHYRVLFISTLKGDALMKEIEQELGEEPDLSQFDPGERKRIALQWVKHGDIEAFDTFMSAHAGQLEQPWRFWFLLRKNQARFKESIEFAREALTEQVVPEGRQTDEEAPIARLERAFMTNSRDLSKGTALLRKYLAKQDYRKILSVCDRMIEQSRAPVYVYYWRAEALYQLQDYVECWYAFEAYLGQLDAGARAY
ncbi:O-antigen ligase family protein [Coraliomargarita parva]|uniref:O-antigen ligase family protein n=1 Tax=Coraliomargarita parva TaxID=3014050 RepID=UPI0022B34F16|nr:O-antigen ligase family protein [Coraliomargarita parva]